jgi:hypothetical protein
MRCDRSVPTVAVPSAPRLSPAGALPQVVGEVLSGNTMRASRHHALGEEFDLDVYGQFCKISTGSMRHLFIRD